MNKYYDYCDTYDSYGTYESGEVLDGNNQIKKFSCNMCKQPKLILKKSVNDPIFKCEECAEVFPNNNREQLSQQTQEINWKWFGFF
jgi:transposase-like protein